MRKKQAHELALHVIRYFSCLCCDDLGCWCEDGTWIASAWCHPEPNGGGPYREYRQTGRKAHTAVVRLYRSLPKWRREEIMAWPNLKKTQGDETNKIEFQTWWAKNKQRFFRQATKMSLLAKWFMEKYNSQKEGTNQ